MITKEKVLDILVQDGPVLAFEAIMPSRGHALSDVPQHLQGAVFRYAAVGTNPGSFLCAVFSNNLIEAANRTSDRSGSDLIRMAAFCYVNMPMIALGSEDAVDNWIKTGGMVGYHLTTSRENMPIQGVI